MTFAKWVLRCAGIIGILLVAPFYFIEAQIGRDLPPAITHPEYYYGFVGVTLAWQVAFLIMSSDPLRYRPLMVAAMLEKGTYAAAAIWLFALGRIPTMVLGAGLMDLTFGILFVIAYWLTGRAQTAKGESRAWQPR